MKIKSVVSVLLTSLLFTQGAYAADGYYVIEQLQSLLPLFSGLAFLVGLGLTGFGVYMFYGRNRNPNQYPISQCIYTVLAGVLLLAYAEAYGVLKASTIDPSFAGSSREILALDRNALNSINQVSGTGILGSMMPPGMALMVVGWCYVLGFGAFLRGLYLIKDVGNPQAQHGLGKILTHMFGGMFLMNLVESACILASIFSRGGLGLC